jgi:hypothetical protein
MVRHGRLALVLVLLASFALPAAALPARRSDTGDFGHQLARLWHQVTSHFLAIWGADDSQSICDPNGGCHTP